MRSYRFLRVPFLLILAAVLVFATVGGAFAETVNNWSGKPAKYVFLFIG
ncbi:MAG: hypothetical protein GX436_02470, partial [Synergistaceae bacterium]|nr:hypothetical protein [Synergistaceae bacterium]